MKKQTKILIVGGIFSVMIAILHLVIIIGGPDWYRFLRAGPLASMAEQGSWIPGIVTFGVAVVFFVWGLYAFSGAGLIKHLPFLKWALVIISAIYLLRGLLLIPPLIMAPKFVDSFLVWTSLISLMIGLAYAIGTKHLWSLRVS